MAEDIADAPTMLLRPEERRRRPAGVGLTWKIFLSSAGVVVLAIAGAIGWTSQRATALMEEGVREAFGSTRFVFENIEKTRYDKLQRLNALVAQDPVFKAVVLETDEATQKDDAMRRQELLGSDVVLIADVEGKLLARTDGTGARGEDLSGWPLVAAAREGRSAAGLLAQGERLFHAVALPIGTAGEDLAGVLVSGYEIGDALAEEMKKTTGTEVAFVTTPRGGLPRLAGSTLARAEDVPPLLDFAVKAADAAEPRRAEMGGRSYIGVVSPLTTPSGERAGSLVILRSIAAELATFQRLRDSLLLVGVVAVLFAFVVSYLLARRITGPLRGLVRVAESVKDGEYGVEVPGSGSDEVGALAASIRAMVNELRAKAELERFVAELAGSDPGSASTRAPRGTMGAGTTAETAAAGGGQGEPVPGEIFANRYEILEVIGSGGMGKVYRARDSKLDEVVALKTIRKDIAGAPGAAERFKQEIKLARKVAHKTIMRTHDFGEWGGVQYLTMEYVKGLTLRELVRRQKELPLVVALRVARQVCTGLFAAHDAGVIHRDVKSQNVLIQPNGEIKIMDFGIARPRESSSLTSDGSVVGTPDYMSPEQALGKDVDHRTDIYSAGVMFYELFTGGVLPYSGKTAVDVVMKHVQERPRPPIEVKPAVPAEVNAIVLRMMAKEPRERFNTMADVYSALSKVPIAQTVVGERAA